MKHIKDDRPLNEVAGAFDVIEGGMNDPWELYDDKGWEKATRAISDAVNQAKGAIDKKVKEFKGMTATQIGSEVADIYDEKVDPVLTKYKKFGAQDTASREAVWIELKKYVKKKSGKMMKW